MPDCPWSPFCLNGFDLPSSCGASSRNCDAEGEQSRLLKQMLCGHSRSSHLYTVRSTNHKDLDHVDSLRDAAHAGTDAMTSPFSMAAVNMKSPTIVAAVDTRNSRNPRLVDDDDHDILPHSFIHEHTQATPRSTARSGPIAATLSVQRGRVPNWRQSVTRRAHAQGFLSLSASTQAVAV